MHYKLKRGLAWATVYSVGLWACIGWLVYAAFLPFVRALWAEYGG